MVRLEQGRFRHPQCPGCRVHTTKTLVDADVRWVRRLRICDRRVVDFAFVLQVETLAGWRDCFRVSVAHANLHAMQHSWRSGQPVGVKTMGLIDDIDGMEQAYRATLRNAYPQWREWVARWRQMP